MSFYWLGGMLPINTGTGIDMLLPPVLGFGSGGNRAVKNQDVIDKLMEFYEKYFGWV